MNDKQNTEPANGTGAPLMCWDIFLEGYFLKLKLAEDRAELTRLAASHKWAHNFDFSRELFAHGSTIVVTDPSIAIIYATSNMLYMNGYLPSEVIGKKPTMFQGEETCPKQRAIIRDAITRRIPFEATLVNYRRNREPYDCNIKGFPVFDKSGDLVNFIAFESELER